MNIAHAHTLLVGFAFLGCAAPQARSGAILCPAPAAVSERRKDEPAAPSPLPFMVDQLVVIHRTGTQFTEATIERLKGERVLVTLSPPSTQAAEVSLSDVFPLPKRDQKMGLGKGEFVIAERRHARWEGAEIIEERDDSITVRFTSNGEHGHLGFRQIIKVSPALVAALKDEAHARDFLREAKRHRPLKPPQYKPKVGERVVVVDSDGKGSSVIVKLVNGDGVTVVSQQVEPTESSTVPLEAVAPFPGGRASPKPTVGAYVLLREQSEWRPSRVLSVDEREITLATPDGEKQVVNPSSVLVLE